jgi:hypothetical protein
MFDLSTADRFLLLCTHHHHHHCNPAAPLPPPRPTAPPPTSLGRGRSNASISACSIGVVHLPSRSASLARSALASPSNTRPEKPKMLRLRSWDYGGGKRWSLRRSVRRSSGGADQEADLLLLLPARLPGPTAVCKEGRKEGTRLPRRPASRPLTPPLRLNSSVCSWTISSSPPLSLLSLKWTGGERR